jgi:hypothetical protein
VYRRERNTDLLAVRFEERQRFGHAEGIEASEDMASTFIKNDIADPDIQAVAISAFRSTRHDRLSTQSDAPSPASSFCYLPLAAAATVASVTATRS